MLFNFSIEDLIPLFTIGGVLIIAIYHTLLYFFSGLKLVGSYSLYLWLGLAYLILATTTVPQKTFTVPTICYLISSGVFWFSLLAYLNFLVVVLDLAKSKETRFYRIVKKTYLLTPVYFLMRFPYFFFPSAYVETIKLAGLIMDSYFFFVFGYLIYLLISNKERDIKNYVFVGSILIVFFNMFTSLTYYTQGYIFGLSHVSFISLGFFSDIIFFSLAVGWEMRENIKQKYLALTELSQKELALEIEKQKASDILLTQDFKIETERTKTIIEQRTAIGRRLHDDLSGSLVALRYLVQDFKEKASNNTEKERFEDLETEISSIYKEARNYSHELSKNTTIADSKMSYDVVAYLKKLAEQFSSLDLLKVNININENEINEKLNVTQTKHIYLFFKECIANTIKHSGAKNIWIGLTFKSNLCQIHFADDGKGLDDFTKEGLGMKGMKESIKDLQGTLELNHTSTGISITVEFAIS